MSSFFAAADALSSAAVSFAFGTIATAITKEVTGAFVGVDANDAVFFTPQAALTAGIQNGGGRVSATDVVAITLGNLTAGTLTPNTLTMDVTIIKQGAEL